MKKIYQVILKTGKTHSKSFKTEQKAISEVGAKNIETIKEILTMEMDTTSDGLTNQRGKQFLGRKQSNRINR